MKYIGFDLFCSFRKRKFYLAVAETKRRKEKIVLLCSSRHKVNSTALFDAGVFVLSFHVVPLSGSANSVTEFRTHFLYNNKIIQTLLPKFLNLNSVASTYRFLDFQAIVAFFFSVFLFYFIQTFFFVDFHFLIQV